jgi:hypothetical protein
MKRTQNAKRRAWRYEEVRNAQASLLLYLKLSRINTFYKHVDTQHRTRQSLLIYTRLSLHADFIITASYKKAKDVIQSVSVTDILQT